jgi:hypothetical protein
MLELHDKFGAHLIGVVKGAGRRPWFGISAGEDGPSIAFGPDYNQLREIASWASHEADYILTATRVPYAAPLGKDPMSKSKEPLTLSKDGRLDPATFDAKTDMPLDTILDVIEGLSDAIAKLPDEVGSHMADLRRLLKVYVGRLEKF